MKRNFAFAGLNLNIIIQKKRARENARFMYNACKNKGR